MGLNAYFTFQVVGYHGTGPVSYRLALTAVFVEGFIFVFLSLVGMRQWLVKIIPESVKVASGVGIGLFLTTTGLSYGSGIGAITGSQSTPVSLAGCPPKYLDPVTGVCDGHLMQNPQVIIFTSRRLESVSLIANVVMDWRPLWRGPYGVSHGF